MNIVYAEYDVETMLNLIANKVKTLPSGHRLNFTSDRLRMFAERGTNCVRCSLKGNLFRLETHNQTITPHINLYHVGDDGTSTLLTKDHIYPRSEGGANTLTNYETMCVTCNSKKKNILPLYCEFQNTLRKYKVEDFPAYAKKFRSK